MSIYKLLNKLSETHQKLMARDLYHPLANLASAKPGCKTLNVPPDLYEKYTKNLFF